MRFEVTGTCYPEAQVPWGIIDGIPEVEFNKQVARQKQKARALQSGDNVIVHSLEKRLFKFYSVVFS
jgi:hypothetical protein